MGGGEMKILSIAKTFNPAGTWMDQISNDLLLRLWRKKGCPGVFVRRIWGISTVLYSTPFGELGISYDPVLSGDIHEFTSIPS